MDSPQISPIKHTSFFEENKLALKGLGVALAAVALVAAIYASIKTGFFSVAFHAAISNPILSGVLALISLATVAGVVFLVFTKEKEKPIIPEDPPSTPPPSTMRSSAHLLRTPSSPFLSRQLLNPNAAITKIYEFTLDEKLNYYTNLEKNLKRDGYHQMDPAEKISFFAALMDIDLGQISLRGNEFFESYSNAYYKLRSICEQLLQEVSQIIQENEEEDKLKQEENVDQASDQAPNQAQGSYVEVVTSLKEIVDKNWMEISFWTNKSSLTSDKYASTRNMTIDVRAIFLPHSFHTNYTMITSEEVKAEYLSAAGYVNIREFRDADSLQIDKEKFAKDYQEKICDEWQALATEDPSYLGYYFLAYVKQEQINRVAGVIINQE